MRNAVISQLKIYSILPMHLMKGSERIEKKDKRIKGPNDEELRFFFLNKKIKKNYIFTYIFKCSKRTHTNTD